MLPDEPVAERIAMLLEGLGIAQSRHLGTVIAEEVAATVDARIQDARDAAFTEAEALANAAMDEWSREVLMDEAGASWAAGEFSTKIAALRGTGASGLKLATDPDRITEIEWLRRADWLEYQADRMDTAAVAGPVEDVESNRAREDAYRHLAEKLRSMPQSHGRAQESIATAAWTLKQAMGRARIPMDVLRAFYEGKPHSALTALCDERPE